MYVVGNNLAYASEESFGQLPHQSFVNNMATKLISSLNNVHKSTVSNESTVQDFQTSRAELRRLATFRFKNDNIHSTLSKGLLAKIGFSYTGIENKVKCEACGFEIELSVSDIDLIEQHMTQSPACQFVLDRKDFFAANIQLLSSLIPTTSETNNANLACQNGISHDTNDLQDDPVPQKLFLYLSSNETIDKIRANTFLNWPLITPNAQHMILAGWSYTNIADRVMCVYCNTIFHKWAESDRPYDIHRLKSPQCPFVLLNEKKVGTAPATNITITTEPITQAAAGAVNTTYALACRRHESFQNWPHTEKDPLPSIDSFVDAGFYFTGEKTIVKCFYCDGALRNWHATDDPKVEHARWYPLCAYIRQYIGEDLYEAIQRKNRELKAQKNYSDNANTQTSQIAPWTDDEIDRMVKARLDLPIVEKLRKEGFSMAIIRKTYEMQLKFKKDDFKTDNDLRLACLILDQQVKLINGNEANLLVPQDWMKNFTDDQGQSTQQSQTVQIQVKNIEIPKVIAPIVARPKIMEKSDEEAMPCVLCLTMGRQVACLPCGHLASCVACGHSLKTCPICRAPVKAFVRIYL